MFNQNARGYGLFPGKGQQLPGDALSAAPEQPQGWIFGSQGLTMNRSAPTIFMAKASSWGPVEAAATYCSPKPSIFAMFSIISMNSRGGLRPLGKFVL
jgi:hypothetical protein